MKVSEAIDQLEVGDTVWVKGKVLDFDRGGYDHCPLEVSLFYEDEWIHENDEISLAEPTSISEEKVLELVSTNFRFDKENFWNQLKEIDMLPQAEKVEVPDFVAEWYRANKADLESNIAAAFRRIGSDEHYTKGSIYEWLNDSSNNPIQTLFKMKDGYTVKPKQWVVRQGGSEVWYLQGFRNSLDGDIVKQWCSHEGCIKFTDKSKAEAVATLVEGSVEEI